MIKQLKLKNLEKLLTHFLKMFLQMLRNYVRSGRSEKECCESCLKTVLPHKWTWCALLIIFLASRQQTRKVLVCPAASSVKSK